MGAGLRVALLTDYRLHPDEALFAALGNLIITGQDPWLNQTHLLVDKPPLFYYITASGISVSWASEMTARLPDLFASVISMALVAKLALYMWRKKTAAVLSALVIALSPFGIALAPTVFADPQMTMWIFAALVALSARKWGLGGVLYGLALATKQNAVFFAPLIAAFAIVQLANSEVSRAEILQNVVSLGVGIAIVIAAVILWDANRHARVGFWNAGIEFNNPHRLIRSGELLVRLKEWWFSARYLVASPMVTAMFVVALVVHAFVDLRSGRLADTRESIVALVLFTYTIAYLAFCWLVAFPVFDRYLLPILPITALLIGRMLSKMLLYVQSRVWRKDARDASGLAIPLIALLLLPAIGAASGRIPVGGDHGSYDGIDLIAAYMRDQPSGTVLYYDFPGLEFAVLSI